MKFRTLLVSALLFTGVAHSAGFQERDSVSDWDAKRKQDLQADVGKKFYVYPKEVGCINIYDTPQVTGARKYENSDHYSFVIDALVPEIGPYSSPLNPFYKVIISDGTTGYVNAISPLSQQLSSHPADPLYSYCLSAFSPTDIASARQAKDDKAKAVQDSIDAAIKREAAKAAALNAKPGVRIGMTAKQVREKSSWGEPESVNRTITGNVTHEQWVYGDGNYLYFTNGKLTSIQN